jgi:hypothetical protein
LKKWTGINGRKTKENIKKEVPTRWKTVDVKFAIRTSEIVSHKLNS